MSQSPEPVPQGKSLEDVHRTVKVPHASWWRRLLAFTGPAYLVSVGYMDPGNWATDLEGGAKFGYALIWVLLLSNLLAILLQTLSARLGLVTGRDLAQACHDEYPKAVNWILFLLCEVAIAACDLAEVLGSAIGLNLLFHLPVLWGVLITGGDVLVLLLIQHFGVRKLESLIILLISTIGICFLIEIYICQPSLRGVASGFVPKPLWGEELYVAIGILGATVMPHNLYLHSALVQSRDVARSRLGVADACRYNFFDAVIAMNGAFLVNTAILVVAAATFWRNNIVVTQIQQASQMLSVLGSSLARIAFAVALICAGQSSTITGTLAGQITMEGFLRLRIKPWLRRAITRLLAIVPAVLVIWLMGEEQVFNLLIFSQVILSLQLSFAVIPLVKFTGSKRKMGPFASPRWLSLLAWGGAVVIIILNASLIVDQLHDWIVAAGGWGWGYGATVVPLVVALMGLLAWLCFKPERPIEDSRTLSPAKIAATAVVPRRRFQRIGVALEVQPTDAAMLAQAIDLAKIHHAELVLMHVVDGVGGTWYGAQTGDMESRDDEAYLHDLAARLAEDLKEYGVPAVEAVLGYGKPSTELIQLARSKEVDLMVLGGHGHRGLSDLLFGETIGDVRHSLDVPVFTVRPPSQ